MKIATQEVPITIKSKLFKAFFGLKTTAEKNADGIERWTFKHKRRETKIINLDGQYYFVNNYNVYKVCQSLNEAIKIMLADAFNYSYTYDDAWVDRELKCEALANEIAFELYSVRKDAGDVFYSWINQSVEASFRSKTPVQNAMRSVVYSKVVEKLKNEYNMWVHS